MKISEIRNNLFGLEDLKGLIKENAFNEGKDGFNWINFFKDDPERLKLTYSTFQKLFPEIAENDRYNPFRVGVPSKQSFNKRKAAAMASFNTSKIGADALFEYFNNNNGQSITPSVLLTNNINGIRNYFQNISELALGAIHYIKNENIDIGNLVKQNTYKIGIVNDPFSMFLYFIFCCCITKQGVFGVNELKNSIPNQFKEYVKNEEDRLKSLLNGKEYDLVSNGELDGPEKIKNTDYLQQFVFNNIGLNYGDLLTSANLQILENAYFGTEDKVNRFLQEINCGQFKTSDIKERHIGTVGGLLTTAAYILSFDISKNIEELTNTIRPFIAATPSIRPIYQMVYFVKYKRDFAGTSFNNIFQNWSNRLVTEFNMASYGVSSFYELFDLFSEVNTATITQVVKNILALNQNESEKMLSETKFRFDSGNESTIKKILTEFSSLGLAKHSTFYSLTPFERLIDMMGSANKLLNKNISGKRYGGDEYLVISNMFRPLSEIYKEDTDSDQKIRSYKKNAEKVYGEDLILGQLVSYVEDSHDRTQNEIYSFLLANLPNGYNNTWEYNRTKKIDKALGDQSIDILYTTYNGDLENPNWFDLAKEQNDKVLSIEYQGEGHCRPSFIKPSDESVNENDGVIYWWTKIKLEFLKKFKDELTRYQEKLLRRKDLVSDKLVSTNLKEVYESIFEMLVGKPFLEVYDIFNPFKITLDEFKRKTHLNEIADVLPDEYIKATSPEHEVVQTIYALLLQYNGIHYTKNTGIPNGFKFVKTYDEAMKQQTISLLKMYPKKELGYEISFLGSPNRFYEEINAQIRKITDERKSSVIKKRGWAGLYILPSFKNNTVSNEDVEFTQQLANPSSFVFQWDETEKNNILASIMGYLGEPKVNKETSEESLFESIIRELFSDNNFQLN